MSAHHIDPLMLTHYHQYRAFGRKPATAWRCAIDYTRTVHAILAMRKQRQANRQRLVDCLYCAPTAPQTMSARPLHV